MFNAKDFEFLNRWSAVYPRVLPRFVSEKAVEEHCNAGRVIARVTPSLHVLFNVDVTDILKPEDGIASIPVTNAMMRHWNISVKNLFDASMKNLKNTWDNSCVCLMEDVLCLPSLPFSCGMAVISNKDRMNGAIVAMQAKRAIARVLGTDEVYLLPSSVHEMLAIRKADVPDVNDIYEMVCAINSDSDIISENDFLADDVYSYDRDGRLVSVIRHDTETVNIEYQYEKVKAVAYAD